MNSLLLLNMIHVGTISLGVWMMHSKTWSVPCQYHRFADFAAEGHGKMVRSKFYLYIKEYRHLTKQTLDQ